MSKTVSPAVIISAVSVALLMPHVTYLYAMPSDPAHEQLLKLNPAQQKESLAALLRRSGESCGSATKTYFQMQDAGGRAFWNVACSNGNSYYIRINADKDGTSEISDCAQIKRLAGRGCFDKVKDIPSGWRGGE